MSTKKRWVTPSFDSAAPNPVKKRSSFSKHIQHPTNTKEPPVLPRNESVTWLEQYQPKTLDDLVVHSRKLKELEDWFRNYKTYGKEKYLLLNGPCGCGKTTSFRVLAKQFDYDVVEWITPLDRDYDPEINNDQDYQSAGNVFEQFLSRATRYPSLLSSSSKMILVKDLPNVFMQNPEALHDILRKYLLVNTYAVVFIFNDDQITRNLFPDTLRKECNIRTINFNPVHCKAVLKALQRVLDIARKSNPNTVPPKDIDLDQVYQNSAGDLRSAILKLYFTAVSNVESVVIPNESEETVAGNKRTKDKDEGTDLFQVLGRVLYSSRRPSKDGGYSFTHNPNELVDSVSMQPSSFLGFLQENYVSRFSNIKDVSAAAKALSYADILLTSHNKDSAVMALAIACRGLMVANNNPVKSFKPFMKSRFREEVLRTNIRDEIRSTFSTFGHSPQDIILYTIPLLSKNCAFKFAQESQTKLAFKATSIFRK